MANGTLDAIFSTMITAAKGTLQEDWPEAKQFVETATRSFAASAQNIGELRLQGMSEDDARFLLDLHKRSMKMVMTAARGISLAMAERAINAALTAARALLNQVVGFAVF